MADKISKQILQWSVTGEATAIGSLNRVAAAQRNTQKATEQLHQALTDIRVESASEELGKKYGLLAQDITKAYEAEKLLSEELQKIGASKSDIDAAASAFERFRTAADDAQGGVGKSGTFGLKTFGRELKALPSVQIPGVGIGTDAIGKVTQLLGNLSPAALAAGASLGLAAGALLLVSENAKKVAEAAKASLSAQDRAVELLRTGSREQIQAKINELENQRKINAEIKKNADDLVDGIRRDTIAQYGGGRALQSEINSVLGTGAGELTAAKQRADEAAKAVAGTNTELETLEKQSGLTAQGLDEIAASARNVEYIGNDIANRANADLEAYQLANNGTSKQLEERRRALQLEAAVIGNNIDAANSLANALGRETAEGKKAADEAADLTKRYNSVSTTLNFLSQSFIDAAIAQREKTEKEVSRIKELAQDRADITVKYNEDILKADDKLKKDQADAADKYNSALVKAADTAALAADNALFKLNDAAEKLATGLQRGNEAAERKSQEDSLNAAIKFQQTEAKQARDHADDLLKIQREAQDKEADLIASRDFAGLFKSRRDTTRQLQVANEQYTKEQQDRLAAFQVANDDRARQYAFEAQERQIKYQQSLQDAQAAYQKDLSNAQEAQRRANAQATVARDQQLKIAADGYNAQTNMLYTNVRNQLSILGQGYTAAEQQAKLFANALVQSFALQSGLQSAPSAAGLPGAGVLNKNSSFSNTTNVYGGNPIDIAAQVSRTVTGFFKSLLG